jgi:anti-sigma factor RsiW
MQNCPPQSELSKYLSGLLDETDAAGELEQHIESCVQCAQVVEELASSIDVEPFRSFIDAVDQTAKFERVVLPTSAEKSETTQQPSDLSSDDSLMAIGPQVLSKLLDVPHLADRENVAPLCENEFDFPGILAPMRSA